MTNEEKKKDSKIKFIKKAGLDLESIILYVTYTISIISHLIVRNYIGCNGSTFIEYLKRLLYISPVLVLLVYSFIGFIQYSIGLRKSDSYDTFRGRKKVIVSFTLSLLIYLLNPRN